jgi:hypothetical protein
VSEGRRNLSAISGAMASDMLKRLVEIALEDTLQQEASPERIRRLTLQPFDSVLDCFALVADTLSRCLKVEKANLSLLDFLRAQSCGEFA